MNKVKNTPNIQTIFHYIYMAKNDELNSTFEFFWPLCLIRTNYFKHYVCRTENFEEDSNSGQGLGDGKANKDWRYKSHLSAKP